MVIISLDDLKFKSYHGIHEEEKILGNDYIVNCSVQMHEQVDVIGHLGQTVNYQLLFELIRAQMDIPTPLLETVCMRTGEKIREAFPNISSVSITIKKRYPPVPGIMGSSSVTWQKTC